MSWLQRLNETYDACFGRPQFQGSPLTPIDHVEQQAHIEVAIDECGNFLRASIVSKENTLIPATEKSAGRASGPAAHPLCDKLRYVAADYGSPDHKLYLEQLRAWVGHSNNPRLVALLAYIERGTVVSDLVRSGILTQASDGTLEKVWAAGPSPLAKLLSPDPKTRQRDQGQALIRWRIETPGDLESAVWKDPRLQSDWAAFNSTLPANVDLCFISGERSPLAVNHPKRLRHGGDQAKIISSNDESGFTFRGRFSLATEAYGLSASATQKAHNALRWLIARQGASRQDQTVVAWEVQSAEAPPVLVDSMQFLLSSEVPKQAAEPMTTEPSAYQGDAGQRYAKRLAKAVRGYSARLDDTSRMVVMALDSATPGRMAIVYYRELAGSELLARLERWHSDFAWPQNFGKEHQFTGAAAPRDIAEAAYGRRVDDKLRKATVERLLPCIVDGSPLPRDLMLATVARATNRVGLERWEFERVLGIACSLVRGSRKGEEYRMSLEEDRHSRSYLFGRLLAIAEQIESYALYLAKESRDTTAERLMQRFADHPAETWRTIELSLKPYMQRLQNRRPATLFVLKQLLDDVTNRFQGEDFSKAGRLDPEFLLGYHCQRAALRPNNAGKDEEIAEETLTAA